MEELGPKEGGVGTAENGERLHDSDMLCEPKQSCELNDLLKLTSKTTKKHKPRENGEKEYIHKVGWPSDGAAKDAMKKSKECSSKSHGEEGEDGHEDVVARDTPGEGGKGVHGVVEDDADTVVEERLTKDKEVEASIDLKKGKCGLFLKGKLQWSV